MLNPHISMNIHILMMTHFEFGLEFVNKHEEKKVVNETNMSIPKRNLPQTRYNNNNDARSHGFGVNHRHSEYVRVLSYVSVVFTCGFLRFDFVYFNLFYFFFKKSVFYSVIVVDAMYYESKRIQCIDLNIMAIFGMILFF